MTDDPQEEAVQMRMLALAEQLAAADEQARAIVGPEQRTAPAVLDAANRLFTSGRLDQVAPCRHLDPGGVAWWSPDAPGMLACRDCHAAASANRGDRCDLCRRTGAVEHVLHLLPASPPVQIDEHHIGARPPVIVDFAMCGLCRRPPRRDKPQRKRRR